MAELLTALGIEETKQSKLASDIFVAEDLIIAMQKFYEKLPEGGTKDTFQSTIIELIGVTYREAQKTA